ncbi:protein THEMIS2 [Coturnix japonica]|uniref:protein THEMIS2 n=1 Tax=Coturnix japonica TaxID=93934 RepID=UPI0007774547|nr:protein THEMIS2 [Coturnix japonica]
MEPVSFQEYICSLDPTTLPRILRICSGVYFQGSVYEISGIECCLSTGDLLKVTAVTLQKVICEDVQTGQKSELPPTFQGLFQPSPAPSSHPTSQGPPVQGSRQKGLTLLQAVGQSGGQTQPLLCPSISPHALLLSPVYEVQAIMHLRREQVKIPSTLEVDVEDVTEECQDVHFARPLLLSELLGMEELLPAQAEILEAPHGAAIFQSSWASRLHKGQRLQIHGCSHTWRVLASARSSTRRFLLSSSYRGRFRLRPRQFVGVQELAAGLQPGQRLHVVVTQDCEGRGDDVPPLSVGDRLEAQWLLQNNGSTRLLCRRRSEGEDGEDEEGEELLLPLDLGGGFVEEVGDNKKYGLEELLEQMALPCDVRVAATDPSMERDVLGSFSSLRLEARISQPFLLSSFCEEPDEGFEIPPRWLDLSLVLTEEPVSTQSPSTHCSHVEELTEAFYYQLLAQLPGGSAPPPPRPPKPKAQTHQGRKNQAHPKGRRPAVPQRPTSPPAHPAPSLPLKAEQPPIQQSTPNKYSPCPRRLPAPQIHDSPGNTDVKSSDDEHNYEAIESSVQKTIRKVQTILPF